MLNKKMFKTTKRQGVTLVELLLIVLILAVLSVVVIPQITQSAQEAKQGDCDANVDTINSAIEMHNADNGAYPATLEDVIGTKGTRTAYYPDGLPQCPFSGTYIMNAKYRVTCSHNLSQRPIKYTLNK
jgi:competence protein ComGC